MLKRLLSWICISALIFSFTAYAGDSSTNPSVTIHTSMGNIIVELYSQKAPITVKNFLKYTKTHFYAGTIFHRVIKGFMIQGGGYTTNFKEKQGFAPIKNEASNGLKNTIGTIAMARTSDPNSATSQFFINVANNNFLNYNGPSTPGYCVFGKVVKGMDVVNKIADLPTGAGGPFPTDVPNPVVVIKSVTVNK